jgi:signal transduction histidine kinase
LRWGLRRRIAVVAGVGLVLAILASTLASRALATAQLRLAQQDRAQAIAEGLAVQLQRILALGLQIDEVQGFDAQCREAQTAHDGVAFALVLAHGGGLLASAAADGDAAALAAEVQAAVAEHGLRPPALSDGSHAVAVPVRDLTNNVVAKVVVGFPSSLLDDAGASLMRAHAAVGAATMVLALGLLWLAMSRLVTRPVAALVEAMNGIDPKRPVLAAERSAVRHDPDLVAIDDAVRRLMDRIGEHESELVSARDAALQANRLKTEFLAVMSHELRTPLNAVLGMAQLLETTPLDARQRGYVGHVRQGGNTLLAVVNDVLDLASIEAGRLQLRPQTVALAPLLQSVVALHEALAKGKGLAMTLDVDPALPPTLSADPQRLHQILGNLLSNAVKFTERGAVALRAEPMADGIRLIVRDTGPGIPADFQPHLFEAFRQSNSGLSRTHTGTGLGLAIVRRLARAMGGEVQAQSVISQGATFTVELPLGLARPSMPA